MLITKIYFPIIILAILMSASPAKAFSAAQKNCLAKAKQTYQQQITEAKTAWTSARSNAATVLQTAFERAKNASRHEPYEKFSKASVPLSVHRKTERAAGLSAYRATLQKVKKTYETAKTGARKMKKGAEQSCSH